MATPIRDRDRTEGTTLGSLCEDLGPELLEVVTAPAGVSVPITEVVLHDALEPVADAPGPGRLLLAIGHSPDEGATEQLLRSAAAAGVVAVACRKAARLSGRALASADRSTVALLCVPDQVEWNDLFELVDAAIAVDRRSVLPESQESGGSGLEDLFALAETVARIAGGPVTIDDAQSRILAFSAIASSEEVDEARLSTILNRRVQEPWRKEMLDRGILRHLLSSRDVLHVDSSRPDKRPRRVIAVCHGATVLGSIWLAGDAEDLSPDADEALRRAAPIAAYLMMRQRIGVKAERRLLESHVATLLRDGNASPGSLEQVGLLAGKPLVTVAVEAVPGEASSPAPFGPRMIDLLSMQLSSYPRPAVVCPAQVAGGRAVDNEVERLYILATCAEGDDDRLELQRVMTECVRYAGRIVTGGLRAGIGYEVERPEDVPLSRRSADECLALADDDETVTMYEEIQDRALLAAIDQVVTGWGPGPSAAFTALIEYDEQHNAGLVSTLKAVLDHAGDTMKVAKELHLHANSVRYRVKRAAEIAGVDLEDADARLALQLELRART